MASLLCLDDWCSELIAGGRCLPRTNLDFKAMHSSVSDQVFDSRAKADRGGRNTVAATQDAMQINNVGYLAFG